MTTPYHLGRTAAAAATVAVLAGCSTVNPYQRQPAMDSDLGTRPAAQALAGGLDEALRDIHAQRDAWFESLSAHARVANAASLSVYAISAWGLYQGLKPGFVANGAATESSRANLAKAGIGAGSAYALGNLFINDRHDEAYVEGFKALTCLMARSRPYQLKQSSELGDLRTQIEKLEALLLKADGDALQLRWADGLVPQARKGSPLQQALSSSQTAIKQGRLTLERARMLVSRVETVGFQLRRQGDLVVASVSEELRRNNKGVASPDEFLTRLQAVTGRFQAIAPVEASDDEADDTASSPGSNSETSTSTPTESTATNTSAPAPSPATAPTAAKPAPADAALAALTAQVEALRSAILKPEARKDQAFKQLDEQTQKLKKQLDAAEADIRKLKQAAAAPPPPTLTVMASADAAPTRAKATLLAQQVADLYHQRRKVNQYLVNHNDLANRVKNIPECRAGSRPTMTVLPGEDRSVGPGKYRFVISGAKGVPLVSLDGQAGTPADGSRNPLVTVEGGTVVVDLVVTDKASGALRLMVHDPVSRATEDVVLTVVAPAKKP